MRRAWFALAAVMLLGPWSFAVTRAAEGAPDALIKKTVQDVLSVVRQNADKRTLREVAETKVVPHFDFGHMTQLAVGRPWRDATPTQQQALVEGFRSLVVNTYVSALSATARANEAAIEVRPVQLQPQQNEATVRTLVKEPGKQAIAIDYKVSHRAAGWKVYDVSVENLSLVTNYRGSFAGEISRNGIDGLIRALDVKNRALQS